MKFSNTIFGIAMASLASAAPVNSKAKDTTLNVRDEASGKVSWISNDDLNRVVHCTPSPGSSELPSINLPAGQTVDSSFPSKWEGNCWGVIDGETNTGGGMLAEFCWQAWDGINFFDVSSIVDANDTNNVKLMLPADGRTPTSGCQDVSPGMCDNMYILPDDVQTQSTRENHILVHLGAFSENVIARRSTAPLSIPVDRSYLHHE